MTASRLAILIMLLFSGCMFFDIDFINRRPLDPVPEIYATWYVDTEVCVGVRGRGFDRLRFFVADGINASHEGTVLGVIVDEEITLLITDVLTRFVVMHEMAHYVSGQGNEMHRNKALRDRCKI